MATCKCLDVFEPASQAEWSGSVFSAGCRRSQALAPCGDEGDAFLAMPNMKVPDKSVLLGNMSPSDDYVAECSARWLRRGHTGRARTPIRPLVDAAVYVLDTGSAFCSASASIGWPTKSG